jgi:probable rRNA maturation factor
MLEPIFLLQHAGWKKSAPALRRQLRRALKILPTLAPACPTHGSVTIALADDAAVQTLNRNFRGKNKATNVLSFPQFTPRQLRGAITKKGQKQAAPELGDVILGYQYIVAEANKDHKILINHVTHLMIHGILHIMGYNHETQRAAHKMETLETKLMAKLGLPDPYQPLTGQPLAAKASVRAEKHRRP